MDTSNFPVDVVLVRHGQSEGNLAQEFSKRADDRLWSKLQGKHTSQYRLTETGREEAAAAGEWIRSNIDSRFDRYFCSEFVRAMETAALLSLDNAEWQTEFYLREQDRGILGGYSYFQRRQVMTNELTATDSFYWCPPGGESIANACLRIDRFFDNILKQCSGLRVLVVCHGNIMRSIRVRLERMSQPQYKQWQASKDPADRIHNCQIWHYSRRDPNTGRIGRRVKWKRSICPWNLSLSSNEWEKIQRPRFSNEELLAFVQSIPQTIDVHSAKELSHLPPAVVDKAASGMLLTWKSASLPGHGTGEEENDEANKASGEKDVSNANPEIAPNEVSQ